MLCEAALANQVWTAVSPDNSLIEIQVNGTWASGRNRISAVRWLGVGSAGKG